MPLRIDISHPTVHLCVDMQNLRVQQARRVPLAFRVLRSSSAWSSETQRRRTGTFIHHMRCRAVCAVAPADLRLQRADLIKTAFHRRTARPLNSGGDIPNGAGKLKRTLETIAEPPRAQRARLRRRL